MSGRQAPVTLLTGFLGAGKTTLLNALLVRPELSRTAVVVNEFGEIGIDHLLVASVDGDLLVLTTGCICCTARGVLVDAMHGLLDRRRVGQVVFDRIVVETTGMADPGPILAAMRLDPVLHAACRVDTVMTVVDALDGAATLEAEPEAWQQVALADMLVVSKTDLVGADRAGQAALEATLRRLNPIAPILSGQDAAAIAAALFEPSRSAPALGPEPAPASKLHRHGGVDAVCLTAGVIDPALVDAFLGELLRRCGSALLRLKGIVASARDPDRPLVLQAVGPRIYPAERLETWPTSDRSTRLVVILRHGPASPITDLWAAFFGPPAIDQPDAAGLLAWHASGAGLL